MRLSSPAYLKRCGFEPPDVNLASPPCLALLYVSSKSTVFSVHFQCLFLLLLPLHIAIDKHLLCAPAEAREDLAALEKDYEVRTAVARLWLGTFFVGRNASLPVQSISRLDIRLPVQRKFCGSVHCCLPQRRRLAPSLLRATRARRVSRCLRTTVDAACNLTECRLLVDSSWLTCSGCNRRRGVLISPSLPRQGDPQRMCSVVTLDTEMVACKDELTH